ncbi:Protein of unknown function [Pyronema omphalodes CBS 100304]|uniref:Uncharacterized protein n=1 Tax=Pyronema omphalodes (strain CBS 100304) TaxID=1076935 RepID=U4LDQ0_PYROM|nr:Protein of unknown function [Pyronema omphalodes CBS 100304]
MLIRVRAPVKPRFTQAQISGRVGLKPRPRASSVGIPRIEARDDSTLASENRCEWLFDSFLAGLYGEALSDRIRPSMPNALSCR